MKKAIFLISLIVLSLGVSSVIYADAIVLKNGRVMTGKIVEKNEKYIVLKTGTGEATVKTTIFLEDINRIEGEDGHVQNVVPIPAEFLTGAGTLAKPGATGVERIKDLLEENSRAPSSVPPAAETISGEEETTAAQEVAKGAEQEKFLSPLAVHSGIGTISGIVSLPSLSNLKETRGDLYIYLMEDTGTRRNSLATWIPYVKIDNVDITSRQTAYKINRVPAGTYQVFAQWHIAPLTKSEEKANLAKVWGFIGTKGDYMGISKENIVLAPDEERTGVDIDCSTLVQANMVIAPSQEEDKIQIEDLYYQSFSPQQVKFILLVKNKSNEPADLSGLSILINDEKVTQSPLPLTNIAPQKECEVDVTDIYEAYKRYVQEKNHSTEVSLKTVRFKVIKSLTGEVEFEKVLFIP